MGRSRVVAALAAAMIMGSGAPALANPGGVIVPTPAPTAPSPRAEPPENSIDRNFAITLGGAQCGRTDLAPAAPRVHPKKGQFCVVRLSFENVTEHIVFLTLSAWVQRGYTADGKGHWGDLRASEAVTNRGNPFVSRVPARGKITGTLVFDLPAGAKLAKLHVRESLTTSGVDVAIP